MYSLLLSKLLTAVVFLLGTFGGSFLVAAQATGVVDPHSTQNNAKEECKSSKTRLRDLITTFGDTCSKATGGAGDLKVCMEKVGECDRESAKGKNQDDKMISDLTSQILGRAVPGMASATDQAKSIYEKNNPFMASMCLKTEMTAEKIQSQIDKVRDRIRRAEDEALDDQKTALDGQNTAQENLTDLQEKAAALGFESFNAKQKDALAKIEAETKSLQQRFKVREEQAKIRSEMMNSNAKLASMKRQSSNAMFVLTCGREVMEAARKSIKEGFAVINAKSLSQNTRQKKEMEKAARECVIAKRESFEAMIAIEQDNYQKLKQRAQEIEIMAQADEQNNQSRMMMATQAEQAAAYNESMKQGLLTKKMMEKQMAMKQSEMLLKQRNAKAMADNARDNFELAQLNAALPSVRAGISAQPQDVNSALGKLKNEVSKYQFSGTVNSSKSDCKPVEPDCKKDCKSVGTSLDSAVALAQCMVDAGESVSAITSATGLSSDWFIPFTPALDTASAPTAGKSKPQVVFCDVRGEMGDYSLKKFEELKNDRDGSADSGGGTGAK